MDVLILCTIGLFAGLLGGLFGVGGSIVMIPAMTEAFGPAQHLYQAAAMIVNFFVAAPAVYQHARAGAIMSPVVRRMAPLAVAGVVLGVVGSEWGGFKGAGQAYLVIFFGLFILHVAIRHGLLLARGRREGHGRRQFDPERDGLKAGLLAGVPTGFVGGFLGVGGGIICVPLQSRLLGVPLRNAIANSAATIVVISLIGACTKNYALVAHHPEYAHALRQSLHYAGALIPTAIVGSLIGSRLTHRLPARVLRLALVVFLAVAATRMIQHGWSELRAGESSPARAVSADAPDRESM